MSNRRLGLGAASSVAAGYVATWVSGGRFTAKVLTGVLLLVFVPMHLALWTRFAPWYHLVFLASLFVLPLLGAPLRAPRGVSPAG